MKKAIRELRRWLNDRGNRNWFLPVLLVGMVVAWGAALVPRPPLESRPVMCEKCGFAEIRDLVPARIAQEKCRKCGGPLGFVWKCPECDFEFPLVLSPIRPGAMTPEQELAQRLREWRCPNCRSPESYLMGVWEFNKIHGQQ